MTQTNTDNTRGDEPGDHRLPRYRLMRDISTASTVLVDMIDGRILLTVPAASALAIEELVRLANRD